MKPRTVIEKEVDRLSKRLPSLTARQKEWAFEKPFENYIYTTKDCDTFWCTNCGAVHVTRINESPLSVAIGLVRMKCPQCGREYEVQLSRKKIIRKKSYCLFITVYHGWQVLRFFSIDKSVAKGQEPFFCYSEVIQYWIREDGKSVLLARSTVQSSLYYDLWAYGSPLSIKRANETLHPSRYEIGGCITYPHRRIIPKLRRNGLRGDYSQFDAHQLFVSLLKDNDSETLFKVGQKELLRYKLDYYYKYRQYIPTVRVAVRHGYIVKTPDLWFDYLDCVRDLGLDLHNPSIVCPDDLSAAHDRMYQRRQNKRDKERLRQNILNARNNEEQYRKIVGRFLPLEIIGGNIVIRPIQSVEEMAEEGMVMHHCVFANEYYKKESSLILSARDLEGNRLETVEVNLEKLRVEQSRGKFNRDSQYHQKIVSLVTNNMNRIYALNQ